MFKSFIPNNQFLLGPMAPFSLCFLFKETYILLLCFFTSHSLFYPLQSGFCPYHSVETVLSKVISDYLSNGNF